MSITTILSILYEKKVSHKLSSFCEKFFFCLLLSLLIGKVWAALLTISHHLQKSLDAEMEFYIVQLDFSAACDSESQRSLIQIEVNWYRWQCAVHL